MKLLNDFAVALVQPRRYKDLLGSPAGRTALYVIILVLISSVPVIAGSVKLYGILGQYYANNIPEFTFENCTLKSEDKFDVAFAGMKLMIDTDNQLTEEDFDNAFEGILFDNDSMLVKTGVQTIEVKYSDVADEAVKFNKSSLYIYEDLAKVIFLISALISVILLGAGFMLGALITALIASLLSRSMLRKNAGLSFSQLYKLALYSRGLPAVLSLILSMLIGGIPWIISLAVSVIILNTALSAISIEHQV